jgi:sugar lactone lactonase YvrE
MNKTLVRPVDEVRYRLGEGPVWDESMLRLYWVDITGKTLHWYNQAQGTFGHFQVDQKIGAISLTTDHRLLAALEHGFYFLNLATKTVECIADTESNITTNRFNDGKCDPQGRFWAGTMSMAGEPEAGKLYMLDRNLAPTIRLEKLGCSNGIAWSPDQKTMYFIDSLAFNVTAYDFSPESGEISAPRVIITFTSDQGFPDGMTIDTDGMLWIAMWAGWNVSRYDPSSGTLLQKVDLPVAQVSSCTFGGPHLSDLYITTARDGLSQPKLEEQPLAGSLFVVENTAFKGFSANRFSIRLPAC